MLFVRMGSIGEQELLIEQQLSVIILFVSAYLTGLI